MQAEDKTNNTNNHTLTKARNTLRSYLISKILLKIGIEQRMATTKAKISMLST
jgi:hypothetical protein